MAYGQPTAALRRAPFITPGRAALRRGLDAVAGWHRRWLDRQRLAELDDRQLRDLGLARRDVAGEIRKPFWRP